MRIPSFVTAALLTAGLLTGCGGDAAGDSDDVDLDEQELVDLTGADEVTIDAIDNTFRPQYAEVSPGATVTFDNRGRNAHNVLAVETGAFEDVETTEFQPYDTAEITFDEPGDYLYYCSLHGTTTKGMVGGIRVVE